VLWFTANAGCGKSVICKSLLDHISSNEGANPHHTVVSFFFEAGLVDRNNAVSAMCAILHQFLFKKPTLMKHAIEPWLEHWITKGKAAAAEFKPLWQIFVQVVESAQDSHVTCILDGLDECKAESRERELLHHLIAYYSGKTDEQRAKSRLKFMLASRPDNACAEALEKIPSARWQRLRGEDYPEMTNSDAALLIKSRLDHLKRPELPSNLSERLGQKLIQGTDRTFLWAALTLDLLEKALRNGESSPQELEDLISSRSTEETYIKMLSQTTDYESSRRLFRILLAAYRPLDLAELNRALSVRDGRDSPEQVDARFKPSTNAMEAYIVGLCGNFVRIIGNVSKGSDKRVYFVHQTARDFLLVSNGSPIDPSVGVWQHTFTSYDAHLAVFLICGYMIRINETSGTHMPLPDTLCEYAVQYWPSHARATNNKAGANREVLSLMRELCDTSSQIFERWYVPYCRFNPHDSARPGLDVLSQAIKQQKRGRSFTRASFLLKNHRATSDTATKVLLRNFVLAAYLGLVPLIREMLEQRQVDVNGTDFISGFSAADCAAAQQFGDTIELLASFGAKISEKRFCLQRVGLSAAHQSRSQHINSTNISVSLGSGTTFAVSYSMKGIMTFKGLVSTPVTFTSREGSDLLHQSENMALILYDVKLSRGWVVSELHVATQMARSQEEARQSNFIGEPKPFPLLEATRDFLDVFQRIKKQKMDRRQTGNTLLGLEWEDVKELNAAIPLKEVRVRDRPDWWDWSKTSCVLFGCYLE
jgi:hypothetical protein